MFHTRSRSCRETDDALAVTLHRHLCVWCIHIFYWDALHCNVHGTSEKRHTLKLKALNNKQEHFSPFKMQMWRQTLYHCLFLWSSVKKSKTFVCFFFFFEVVPSHVGSRKIFLSLMLIMFVLVDGILMNDICMILLPVSIFYFLPQRVHTHFLEKKYI